MPELYLRPCPFCGSSNIHTDNLIVDYRSPVSYYVSCQDCQSQGPRSFVSEVNAVALWNKRVLPVTGSNMLPDPDLEEHEKAIREILDRFMKGKIE